MSHLGRPAGTNAPTPGYESLRNAVYRQAVMDYKRNIRSGYPVFMIERFLVSGAYQIDADAGRTILERLRRETCQS